MFLLALKSHFYLLHVGASTSPYIFSITAARIIIIIIAAPLTDIRMYKDCRRFSFGVGVLPLLVVGGVLSCVYSSVTFITVLPAPVVVLVLLTVVGVWHSKAENCSNPTLHDFTLQCIIVLSSSFQRGGESWSE